MNGTDDQTPEEESVAQATASGTVSDLLPSSSIDARPEGAFAATDPGGDIIVQAAAKERAQRFPITQWDKYEFLAVLGEGGMGVVYKARDLQLGRIVALKFIHGDSPVMSERFLQEARAQARLNHINICRVYEVGTVEGKPYIAMEFVEGKSLDQIHSELNHHDKVQLIRDAALALHDAHRLGVIHRDIKPANIMVERKPDGRRRPVVMDFGLARESAENRGLTETGAVMGTPAYMPPEQARGRARYLDRRADVYSLGATFYEILTGQPPFTGQEIIDVLLAVLNEDPRPIRTLAPDIPTDLGTITHKCLAKEPGQRYDSARALAEDLQRYLDGEPILAKRISTLQSLSRRARKNKPLVALAAALLGSLIGLITYGVKIRLDAQQHERRANLERDLAQKIKDMEWMMRSSRQLPLHDLGNEKVLLRKRMQQLQRELQSYGALGRGLIHYALGRGHLALQEYEPALAQLQQAAQDGNQSGELHFALGLVLGKKFEQAMYEIRLSGGGEWAKQQRKKLEPQYLLPAIAALQRSREANIDSPGYLEALIGYYQRDYDKALQLASTARQTAPWLYETDKLGGDIHLERALLARDTGHDDEAWNEFAASVHSYEAAAAVGQSDPQVYEGLAEAWIRHVEMAALRGQPTETAYAAAIAASAKIERVDPESVAGPLKQAFAATATMATLGGGRNSVAMAERGLSAALRLLQRQPDNPYATEQAAVFYAFLGEDARAHGRDPTQFLLQAIEGLEHTLRIYPQFLWGMNDLAALYASLANEQALRGNPQLRATLEKALTGFTRAATIDSTYVHALSNQMEIYAQLMAVFRTENEVSESLARGDEVFARCISVNANHASCYSNYFRIYALAAHRTFLIGHDPHPLLARALPAYEQSHKLGGPALDAEQTAVLAQWLEAADSVRRRRDPGPALAAMQAALQRCLAIATEDVTCKTLAVRAEWVSADWLALQGQSPAPALQRALQEATAVTRSPASYPDKWQVLAQTHLRLAQAELSRPTVRADQVAAGLTAVDKIFQINPNHALGLATRGALLLQLARSGTDRAARLAAAHEAITSLEQAVRIDPFLSSDYAPVLDKAKSLAAAP